MYYMYIFMLLYVEKVSDRKGKFWILHSGNNFQLFFYFYFFARSVHGNFVFVFGEVSNSLFLKHFDCQKNSGLHEFWDFIGSNIFL